MVIISIILLVIFVISALLLMVLVLIQDEQGEGLGGLFGGGSSTPFGSRSGNVLTKLTSILGAVFIITSLGLAWSNRTPESGDVIGAARRQDSASEKSVDWWKVETQTENQQTAPGVPAPEGKQ
jgi:preprotein translocase subunit SecG